MHERFYAQGAWTIQDRCRFSRWEALVLSAAVEAKCRFLLTEDLQPEQVTGNLTILNPFRTKAS